MKFQLFQIAFFGMAILVLLVLLSRGVFGLGKCEALSCGSEVMETVLANEHYEWTNDDEIGKLISSVQIRSEKEKIVADIVTEEVQTPRYTLRVGLDGRAKPIPKIEGNTKDERAVSLLNTVGLGHTINTWKSFGDTYKMDYTVPLCVAFADSHLGKALKSTNNIGNVGNNDRGDVIHYDTLDKGIEAIFRVLAYGKYMKGHTILGTLSNEGRTRLKLPNCTNNSEVTKKCYASSEKVWSTNITNCLSAIHNKQIDETYNFRLN